MNSKLFVTMEERNVIGDLWGVVVEAISEICDKRIVVYRAGLQDTYTSEIGNQDFLRDYYEINAYKVFKHIMENYRL